MTNKEFMEKIYAPYNEAWKIVKLIQYAQHSQCFTHSRSRFEREFQKAVANNCFIHLICEDGSFEKIEGHKYKSKFPPKSFLASITAWERRYNIHFHFCSSLETGRLIKEFLYRDMKERIERGEFDIGT